MSTLADRAKAGAAWLRSRTNAAATSLGSIRAEILTAAAIVVGWASLTSAIAELVRPGVVWRASIGILLLSICGWKFLYAVVSIGLYKLTRKRG